MLLDRFHKGYWPLDNNKNMSRNLRLARENPYEVALGDLRN